MPNDKHAEPALYRGVMVSSTFTDLVEHRVALMKAIHANDLHAIVMENGAAKPAIDVLDSSLTMVRKASAYIGVISRKYGQVPKDANRNPKGLSLTELEFEEARSLGLPVLLFIMGDDHPVKESHVETSAAKRKKLVAFRENAKRLSADSLVHRVYKVFNNLQEFETAAMQSVAELRRHLETHAAPPPEPEEVEHDLIPQAPALYAEPPYIGSHQFVGRKAQLTTLSDWASPADPHPVLLFEAIGGTGKSMLTWEWTTKHATNVRNDWAGRFWYSFYERGAVMADFCQRALAYMTGKPLKELRKKKTAELSDLLLRHLRDRPWLLVLDGLERVLVAYHRLDAAQLLDEEAGGSDQISQRHPCSAIRPEDDELLRALASAAPSKLLLTSRLIPRVLLNLANQAIPGVLHERLPGLRPPDAEALLRLSGVTGTPAGVQNYLQSHCDCHPLVTGIIAGLINDYLPRRGNFDAWAHDPEAGGALNLGALDLVQKRNHILRAALEALSEKSRQVLSTLAMLSESVDYSTLLALQAPVVPQDLAESIRDLERRGLIQYERGVERYDLHPVVRGIAVGGLKEEERDRFGQRVVDYFSRQAHDPYEQATTIDDVRGALQVVRTLIQLGRFQEAVDVYRGGLSTALMFNLEAYDTALSLIRPLFVEGWGRLPSQLDEGIAASLANSAGIALEGVGDAAQALVVYGASIEGAIQQRSWFPVPVRLSNIAFLLRAENRLAAAERCYLLAFDLASFRPGKELLFKASLDRIVQLALTGRTSEAEELALLVESMPRPEDRAIYREGGAELVFVSLHFEQGKLTAKELANAEKLVREGRDRFLLRDIHRLRGAWHVQQNQWKQAAASLHEAVRMAREIGRVDASAETQLALANFHLGLLREPHQEAERLSNAREVADLELAELWLALGEHEQAKKYVRAAYEWAWADGEPYVRRRALNRARTLLEQLGAEIPDLPPYDPAKDEKFPWEDAVAAVIEELRAEQAQPATPSS